MTTTFDTAFANVIGLEGGYTDDPRDRGNWTGGTVGQGKLRGTKYGISAAAFPTLDIANLTLDAAKAIYRAKQLGRDRRRRDARPDRRGDFRLRRKPRPPSGGGDPARRPPH